MADIWAGQVRPRGSSLAYYFYVFADCILNYFF